MSSRDREIIDTPKRKAGRPRHEPTPADKNTVEALVVCGIPEDHIARVLGIVPNTLKAHYREILDTAVERVHGLAVGKLIAAMVRGEAWAICFYLKTRAGWRETNRTEHTGADGQPLIPARVEVVVVPAGTRTVDAVTSGNGHA